MRHCKITAGTISSSREVKMNSYSRINSKSKSESRHLSDISFPVSSQLSKVPHEGKTNKIAFSEKATRFERGEEEEDRGEMFGVLLSRNRSVPVYKTMTEKEIRRNKPEKRTACNTMKRSSSVSSAGGYSRIQISDDEETENLNFLHRKQGKKEKSKILKACMRLIGFN